MAIIMTVGTPFAERHCGPASHIPTRIRAMKSVMCLVVCFLTAGLAGTGLGADDPTGTWKFTVERNGQQREVVLTLRLEAGKFTGHIPARNSTVTPIDNGKYENGEISFSITRDVNGVKRTSKYSGKLSAGHNHRQDRKRERRQARDHGLGGEEGAAIEVMRRIVLGVSRLWTPNLDQIVRTKSPADAVKLTGKSLQAISIAGRFWALTTVRRSGIGRLSQPRTAI